MPEFSYKAKLTSGSTTAGTIEAPNQRSAMDKLKSQNMIVMEITESSKSPLDALNKYNPFAPKTKSKDIVLFSRQLSTLVSAGVPLVQGLTILGEQIENPAFKTVIEKVREDIEGGVTIADALGKHPDSFTDLYVSMVRAGEVGGILDTILERLSNYLEAAEALKSKIKGAMMYPLVVSIIAGAVTIFLLVGVIPTFKEVFAGFGAELPAPTQVLINISEGLQKYFWAVIVVPILAFVGFKQIRKTEWGLNYFDEKALKLPMFGILLRKVAVAKFTRTLGTLVRSGVPILQALDTVARTSGNKVVEKAIYSARESIREGERISDPLKRSGVFPPMVIQMISVGEETGNLDIMLTKIADFYDQEVDVAVKGLTSMIEPIVIVVMGVVIGSIVICMFMPMFEMSQLAQ